jgi:hypothetical protein
VIGTAFIDYKVDLFGGPAKYTATELDRNVLATMMKAREP